MPGATLDISLPDRYAPLRHLANGGMAAVWAAHDRLLGREVAVKLLAPQFIGEVAAKARFEREARAAASLSSHPNVVTIYDVAEHDGRPLIVMELFKDGTVADRLRRGRIPRDQALNWLAQAAEGLDAAHAHGVIHRDVKPANLLLEGDRLAVADFGIARVAWETSVTQTGQVLGTAAYLSPEQAEGRPASAASDRYALAVVAYELLTGGRPFDGGNFAAQARAHIEDEPLAPSSRDPELPAAVDPVLLRGLAKGARERWASAADMVEALTDALDGPAAATAPPERTRVMASPRSAPPGSSLAWLAAILAFALAIVAVLLLSGGDNGSKPAASPARTQAGRPAAREQAAKTATQAPRQTASAPARAPAAGESASALNARGYSLMQQGRYAEAIPVFQQAVRDCPVSQTDPCAFALFNLGHALRAAGRPGEAIPVLLQRLANPNQRATVEQELAAAQAEAGQRSARPGEKLKPGKGKSHGRRQRD